MKLSLAQLGGMIRYEVRMQWRRGGLLAVLLLLAVVLFLNALWQWLDFGVIGAESAASRASVSPEGARQRATLAIVYIPWMYAIFPLSVPWLLLLLTVPPIAAETIPLDRQVGVRELLDSLPLSRGTYLLGKLLGLWTGVLGGLAGVALLFGSSGWLFLGPYDLSEYLLLWKIGVAPMVLFVSSMSALLAAGQPTRRRAMLVGFTCLLYGVFTSMTPCLCLRDAVSLAQPAVIEYLNDSYFLRTAPVDWFHPTYPPEIVPLALGLGALQVALVWLLVWLWMRWREGR